MVAQNTEATVSRWIKKVEGSLQPSNPAAAIIGVKCEPCYPVRLHAIRLSHLILHLDSAVPCLGSKVTRTPSKRGLKHRQLKAAFQDPLSSPFVSIIIIELAPTLFLRPRKALEAEARQSPPAYLGYRLDDSRTTRTDGRNNACQTPGVGGTFILELILKCILYFIPFFLHFWRRKLLSISCTYVHTVSWANEIASFTKYTYKKAIRTASAPPWSRTRA